MTNVPAKSTVTLAVGMRVNLSSGQQAYVHSWKHGWVQLIDAAGMALPIRTLKSVTRDLMSPDVPPPDNPLVHGLKDRLSPSATVRLAKHEEIVRLVEVGLRNDQDDDATPPDALNPELIPDEEHRISNLARLMAPVWGVKYKSARVRITRILERRARGLSGMVDDRYSKARRDQQHPQMALWVQDYLVARQFDPVLHTNTLYITFRVWLISNHPEVETPPERTFTRLASAVYEKFPHLRAKAKTKESIARAPKQSDAPRIPDRPGELWLIDATTSNVEVRDPAIRPGKAQEFRCDMTKIIDANTRMIVGRSIAETGTGFGAVLALADAFGSMVDERETVTVNGQTYPRPFVGLPRALARFPIAPRRLLTDNGRSFLGHEFVWQLERLGIELEPARVRDPRAKARIERGFGTYKTDFEELQAGFVGGSLNERGEQLPGRHLLTWQQLFRRDEEWTDVHNFSEHRGIEAETGRRISPYQRWVEGVDEIGMMEVPRWENEWIRFLPSFVAKFTKYGVTRKGQVFNAPILEMLLLTPKVAVGRQYRFRFDPSDLRQIYCFDPEGMAYEIPWTMRTEDTPQFGDFTRGQMDQRYAGLTLDHKAHQDRMVEYLMRWLDEDSKSGQKSPLLSRNEEMNSSALERLASLDQGRIGKAPAGSRENSPEAWSADLEEDGDEDSYYFTGEEDPFEAFR